MEPKNNDEWEKKLLGKTLLEDNAEHILSNAKVYMYS